MNYKKIIILGLTPQGLALLRTYSKAGYEVVAAGFKDDVGIYSKYGQIYVLNQNEDIVQFISEQVFDNELVHITSDILLNYLLDNHLELFHRYNVYPTYKSALIFRDKYCTKELADRLKINTPETFCIDDLFAKKDIPYPIIGKWNKYVGKTPFKTIMIENHNFLKNLKHISQKDNLIFQRYIPGNPESDISYGGYWISGVEKIGIVVRQQRQFPFPVGLSSKVEEIKDLDADKVKKYARLILKKSNFCGFVEVECRKEASTGKLFLIEVNPRACGWIKILMDEFSAKVLYNGKIKRKGNEQRILINIVRDLRAIVSLLKHKPSQFHFTEIINDYFNHGIKDILDFEDLKPFIFQFRKLFR